MSYSNLLERIMQRDTDAFLELTDRYGWALYSFIRRKYPNKINKIIGATAFTAVTRI